MWDASWILISDPKLAYWMSVALRTTVAYCLYALFAPFWLLLLLSMTPKRWVGVRGGRLTPSRNWLFLAQLLVRAVILSRAM